MQPPGHVLLTLSRYRAVSAAELARQTLQLNTPLQLLCWEQGFSAQAQPACEQPPRAEA